MSASNNSVPFVIGGEHRQGEKTFEVVSPNNGQTLYSAGDASLADAQDAVSSAAKALPSWRLTTPSTRRDIFLKAAAVMERRGDELAKYLREETGGTEYWAKFNVKASIDFVKDIAGRISSIEGSYPATQDSGTSAIVLREPFGVIFAIAPWNAPYILGARSFAFPVAAGNTVVLKGSEYSPRTLWGIVSAFEEAGLPSGVVNIIYNAPSSAAKVTQALIENPEVKKINFTGSTNVGRIIGKLAGENLKPVVLELGGKAPAIVWEDADLKLAASQCALGAFLNSGQICMSTERIIVHRSIKDQFVEQLNISIKETFQGKALTLFNERGVANNKRLREDATTKGASILYGNLDPSELNTMMTPVVLGNVTKDMDLYMTESFGPTVSVFEVETEEEALAIANDTEYGLSSAVFTEDLRRGFRIARGIETGAVHINSMSPHDEPALPHGGAKASGFGRFNANEGINEWVRTKTVTFKN